MNMNHKSYLTLLATGTLVAFALTGCTSKSANPPAGDQSKKPAEAGNQAKPSDTNASTIHVAADTTFPPFESEVGGKVQGFDIDMINAIAKHANLTVDMKTMQFTGLIPALQSGQVDVAVAGITVKKSRMAAVNFSDAYYKSGLSVITKTTSSVKSIDDLKGKLVGTKKGTSSVDLLKSKGITDIKQFDNIDAAYSALASGGVEAVLFDNPVNLNYANTNKDTHVVGGLLTGEYYGIAISKNKPELQKKINDGLKAFQDSGEYKQLFDKYFGGDTAGMVQQGTTPESVALDDTKK
ncbi:MAG TPA: basic amino acid ABC transporter substrate-binding protein [Bacillota bacterium]|nr:basic amino acid ABC transporter substrate-binding protein [Bacillota bacterium]